MRWWIGRLLMARVCVAIAALGLSCNVHAQGSGAPTGADAQVARAVGTIKSAQEDSLIITPDSGSEVTAKLASSTKILRVPPGEKDLKNAAPIQVGDLQPGDRVLVRGRGSADGRSIEALAVIVMKQADVSARQQRDREDWQKRGVGGLVTAADTSTGNITISAAGVGGNHNIVIHTTKTTTVRRYAPDSVKFDDARSAALNEIKAGDQLRARGTRNADGSELTAEEIVFGSFRNIAGTVTAIDAASNSMTVQDAIGKGSVVVKVAPDSQIKKLPTEIAQRIAMRLKGGSGEQGRAETGSGQRRAPPSAGASAGGQASAAPGMQGQGANGSPDLQRFLGRIPNSTLADLQKGDALMIVSTQGGEAGTVTAITVLAGVEPILTAAPNRSAVTLSPWTLGGAGGEGESTP